MSLLETLLTDVLPTVPALVEDRSLWDTLCINRRKPHTYRVWTMLPSGHRLSLHRFDACATHEAFSHPHPWPGAFVILKGAYTMPVGFSPDRVSPADDVARFILRAGSAYEITNPLTWHSVIPLEETFTVMLNGTPFTEDVAHIDIRTTRGKDLDKMPEHELSEHRATFRSLTNLYLRDFAR